LKPAVYRKIFTALSLFCLAWASSFALAGESYFSLPFEKLLKLAVCAEMKTLGRDCWTMPRDFDERSKALEAGLEDLWALNYGEQNPRKVREASRMIRNFSRFDLGVLVKNPTFAKSALLRAETGIQYLLAKNRTDLSQARIKLPAVFGEKSAESAQKAEASFAKGRFIEMRLELYQALWLADPLTAGKPMPDPAQGQGLAGNPLRPVVHS
jgi:hypothetical protein